MKFLLKKSSYQIFDDIFSLLYPRVCLACGKNIRAHEEAICLTCQFKMPKTNFHEDRENPFTERFWGRVRLNCGSAFFYFGKGGKVQQLIHNLKYSNKPEIGVRVGKLYGKVLSKSLFFRQADMIVPVPLHPLKQRMRGYNQSSVFAQGLSESMDIPWVKALRRTEMTETQTKKDRIARFNNVKDAFEVTDPKFLEGKHILLVDDVITTGATIEACAHKILEIPGTKVSVVTIAFARQ